MPKRKVAQRCGRVRKKQKKSFRLAAKAVKITLKGEGFELKEVYDFYNKKFRPKKICFSSEIGESGYKHFHGYMYRDKRFDTKDSRYFDMKGVHPNIEPCKGRKHQEWIDYICKDGNIECNFDKDNVDRDPWIEILKGLKEGIGLSAMFDEADLKKQVFMTKNSGKIRGMVKMVKKWRATAPRSDKGFRFKEHTELDFYKANVNGIQEKYALFVKGDAGWGKTQFVLSMFRNPLLIRHMDKLKVFDVDIHDALVFDDMSFAHWPREAIIHLVDIEEETDLNVKCGMITIPARTPRVFTTNKDWGKIVPDDCSFDTAILRRIRWVEVVEDLRLPQ